MTHHETIIIGGGLAGLACATGLHRAGKSFHLIEATDRVGGRVRTDRIDGFTLDHGFQVLLTAYPACRQLLDYDALRLRAFQPGALIRHGGRFHELADPWRRPTAALATARNPVGTLKDKMLVAKLRSASRRGTLDELYRRPHEPTQKRLRDFGFSDSMLEEFFRPFLGGVYLDKSLSASSRMLEFVFRMFSEGDVALPADGMDAIPRQLAANLPEDSIRLKNSVTNLQYTDGKYQLVLSDESTRTADRVVVAIESRAAEKLLGNPSQSTEWCGTTNLYYAASETPDERKQLMLRGDESGKVQSATVISNVAPEYAPRGKSLISVSIAQNDFDITVGDADRLDAEVRQQLTGWFGGAVGSWNHLQTFRIPYGLPKSDLEPVMSDPSVGQLHDQSVPTGTLFVAGDHTETPSIQGALSSGMRVAEQL